MSSQGTPDDIVLKVNGASYSGWTEVRVTRSLRECASSFDIAVTERWAGQSPALPWKIRRFDKVQLSIGGETVITGYVEHYEPSYDAGSHRVRIAGRSRTCDLVDSMADPDQANDYTGSKLDQIARALCKPFGIDVTANCDVGDAFPDATIEKTETLFKFLEKLARLRSVILTDDADGNLVLTQAGATAATSALIEGQNIKAASARITAPKIFQTYCVLSQTPEEYNEDGDNAQTQNTGSWKDVGCPRPRFFVEQAENPSVDDDCEDRAHWRALHNYAESTEATITVQGFRQADGTLLDINTLIPVKSPLLSLDRILLIGKVEFQLDEQGRRTELELAPQEAFSPDYNVKGVGNSDPIWTQAPVTEA